MLPDDRLRVYDFTQGLVDAIAMTPEGVAAFEAWDAQLGVSAKARRLAAAELRLQKVRSGTDAAAAEGAYQEAQQAYEAAAGGPDMRGAGILGAASELVRDLGFDERIELAFHLETRFVRVTAASAGRPLEDDDPNFLPDFSPKIGRRFVIPPYWPTWYVRERLDAFVNDVKATADAVEKATRKLGRPATDYRDANRRNGRWYFLRMTGRAGVDDLARSHHRSLGPEHAKEQGEDLCDHCIRHVHRGLEGAREIVALIVNDA